MIPDLQLFTAKDVGDKLINVPSLRVCPSDLKTLKSVFSVSLLTVHNKQHTYGKET